jgi:hypothetical protein
MATKKAVKKAPAKKAVAKKTPAKKAVAKKAPAKKAVEKKAPAKKCGCQCASKKGKCAGKKECRCKKLGMPKGVCFEKLIAEIFTQLEDKENLAILLTDYFFMELVRRGIDEELANKLANSIEVVVESFEAGVGIIEEDED